MKICILNILALVLLAIPINAQKQPTVVRSTVAPYLCSPEDENTLCLADGDLEVTVRYRTAQMTTSGIAQCHELGNEGGYCTFFSPGNPELLIKGVNACIYPFASFWSFYAATTNQEFEVQVTMTKTGERITYKNPLNNAATTVLDTGAIGCPIEVHNEDVVTKPNEKVTTNVLSNDLGVKELSKLTRTPPATEGTVTFNKNGSVTFTPAPGFMGFSQVEYTACGTLGCGNGRTIFQVLP